MLPCEGETMTSNSVGYITRREAGNDSDMTEKERDDVNQTEQQSMGVNAENGSERRTFATNQDQNMMPGEHCDKVNGCSDEGYHIKLDECALKESLQPKCQHISTDCTNTDCDCVAPISVEQNDTEEANQRVRKYSVTSASNSDVGFDPEESVKTPTLEQTGGHFCFTNDDEEERTSAEEDSEEEEEEKRDLFPDYSAQPYHPSSPNETSPNIFTTSAAVADNPPPGSTFTRATFSPGSPTDKQIQLPALFSGLRVLRKGVVGPEHDTVAQIKPSSQGASRDIFPEKQGGARVQGSFLNQISQFLSREKRGDEKEEQKEMEVEGDQDDIREENENEESQEGEKTDLETEEGADADADVSLESTKPSVSSAEAAFDAFKAFFTPKPLKKDPADKVDLEAVRKRMRTDKDVLRSLFERTSNKTPEKKDSPDCKVQIVY